MKKTFVFILILLCFKSYSQELVLDHIIREYYTNYIEKIQHHPANIYACIVDSSEHKYEIAYHTQVIENAVFMFDNDIYILINDTIPLFIRTNSKILKSSNPKATREVMIKANSIYENMPLVEGERDQYVVTVDHDGNFISQKWYSYVELLPDHLWIWSDSLMTNWNDSIKSINK